MAEYIEIQKLYSFCLNHGINATLERLFDGYAIRFPSGGDFIQHEHSYYSKHGCVEPAIGSRCDYTGIPLKNAKWLVLTHKERLNRRATWLN